jgi:hypothetical protein
VLLVDGAATRTAGHRGWTVAVGGEACGRADLAVAGSAEADLAVGIPVAADFGVNSSQVFAFIFELEGVPCRFSVGTRG